MNIKDILQIHICGLNGLCRDLGSEKCKVTEDGFLSCERLEDLKNNIEGVYKTSPHICIEKTGGR